MEYLIQIFSTITSNTEYARWIFAITMGVAITLFGLAALFVASGLSDPLRRRLKHVSKSSTTSAKSNMASQGAGKVAGPISSYALPKKEEELSETRARLRHAGYRAESAVTTYYSTKLLIGIGLPILIIALASFFPHFTAFQVIAFALFSSFIGLMLPNFLLARKVKKRQREILNGFPDALDMLVTCTEAGLGLNAALQRVTSELSISYPALTDEVELVNAEIRVGVDRIQALRNLVDRTGIAEIRGLV
ncbi:MAG: type II secretion system F family protein, partial [Gammaproteobacteria bacterium]